MADDRELLTIDEVAAWLRVHPETVRRWLRTGELQALKIGGTYRVPRSVVLARIGGAGAGHGE